MSIQSRIFIHNCTKSDTLRDKNLKIPNTVVVTRDIQYDSKKQLLDVTVPKLYGKNEATVSAKNIGKISENNSDNMTKIDNGQGEKLPVIISIHGGGYVYGSKEVYQFYAANLAENGFAVVNFNYRLAPRSKFPAPLEDTNNVVKWVIKHADEYNMDLKNVFIVGDSAGGQIASQYAAICTNSEYAAKFAFHVPKDFVLKGVALNCGKFSLNVNEGGLINDYLGKKIMADDHRLEVLSNITKDYPAAYIMTAFYDFLKDEAKPMYELLKSKGINTVYKLYGEEGQQHMCHVFHCNLNLEEAKKCNKDECDFFKSLI